MLTGMTNLIFSKRVSNSGSKIVNSAALNHEYKLHPKSCILSNSTPGIIKTYDNNYQNNISYDDK
jgi:hypothetical protein